MFCSLTAFSILLAYTLDTRENPRASSIHRMQGSQRRGHLTEDSHSYSVWQFRSTALRSQHLLGWYASFYTSIQKHLSEFISCYEHK